MPCKLTPKLPIPPLLADPHAFTAPAGQDVTVFADSDSKTVRISGATLSGAPIVPDAQDRVTFQPEKGFNLLELAFVGSDPNEVFRVKEDCGGGQSQTLIPWRLQATPTESGGPTLPLRIYAV